jgi:nitrite reductase/ring-hydroxylating ferredoxin subunit
VKLEQSTERLYTPHKVKMGVTGCPRNCAEVTVKDIGIMAIQGGWEVLVGGAAGMRVRKTDLLVRVEHESSALEAAHLFLQYYRENAEYLERTYDFLERFGIARVRAETVEAPEEVRAALLERFQRSREIAAEPWAEGDAPATPHQFEPIDAVPNARPGDVVRVAALAELPLGEGRAVRVGARELALFRTSESEVRAIAARCPHAGGPLADGIVSGGKVTCPLHAWKFDLATGEGTSPGGHCDAIPAYTAFVKDGEVFVALPPRGDGARAADSQLATDARP